MQSTTAYLSLGSNIDPKKNLAFAVRTIRECFQHAIVSSVYQTAAEGFEGEDFLNLAIEVKTEFSVKELLSYADKLEQAAGRVRVQRGKFDARTLDVDVLIYGNLVGTVEGRVWPAKDLVDYGHVLKPLAEIAPIMTEPLNGKSFQQLWDKFANKQEFENASKVYGLEWLLSDN